MVPRLTILRKAAECTAAQHAVYCYWLELDDLRQEAWVAVLEAERTWRPDGGASLGTYTSRAASRRLRRFIWEQRAPVTGPQHRPEALRGISRAPEVVLADRSHDPLAVEREERWWAKLRKMVRRAYRDGPRGDVALQLLLRASRRRKASEEIAAEIGMSKYTVLRASGAARRRVRGDHEIKRAYLEGPGGYP